jgi:hypothetical protein
MDPTRTASQILLEAADVLESGGWTRNVLKNDAGAHCALGAVMEVAPVMKYWWNGAPYPADAPEMAACELLRGHHRRRREPTPGSVLEVLHDPAADLDPDLVLEQRAAPQRRGSHQDLPRRRRDPDRLRRSILMDTIVEQSVLHILDSGGDTKILWSVDSPAEVEIAKDTFKAFKKKGYLAYTVKKDGEKGEVIHEFDKLAGRIILAPQLVGG